MKFRKVFSILAILMVMVSFAQKNNKMDYSMYPEAKEGYEQKIIVLQPQTNEENYSVEIFAGKKVMVDSCNRFFLSGNFDQKTVEGWGYNYINFESNGNVGGTMMMCPDNQSVEKTIYAQSLQTRYNSKLPIVVYVPKGYTLEYRIWKADEKLNLVK
ncbi:ecotin family protein [Empedobacter stercoris]|uniref:Ecotin family protein n=1 Tax=Empedobacter falsenii TaxID=343874 RepID=A0ABY8V4Z9_9FLAO|nr:MULTISPECIES: ecotin family protein [Empedobacter]UWX66281.1 ecotin family protein [Empedobacter stercoris]WIH96454.1 ecotin family protein [Empedobacter falsenii]